MHRLTLDLVLAAEHTPEQFANLQQHIPVELILQALAETGTATVRRRRLPAQQVVWLIIGIAMMRDLSIVQVVDRLELALPATNPVAASAVAQARQRLGKAPLEWLFVTTGERGGIRGHKPCMARPALYGVDGTGLCSRQPAKSCALRRHRRVPRSEWLPVGARRRADGAAVAPPRHGELRTVCDARGRLCRRVVAVGATQVVSDRRQALLRGQHPRSTGHRRSPLPDSRKRRRAGG